MRNPDDATLSALFGSFTMPVYIYETMDDGPVVRFEQYQSIKEDALTIEPKTGRPVRRVITGGLEMPRKKADPPKVITHHHSDSCACCNPLPKR